MYVPLYMKLISHFQWQMKPDINQLNTHTSRWALTT